MNMRARLWRFVAAALAVLSLAACGGGSDGAGGGRATPAAWPQPVDGKLTDAMCDVLTADDFSEVGVLAFRWEDRGPAPDVGPNAVTCHALGGHFLGFNLQPDPVSAAQYLRYRLSFEDGPPAATLEVPGADETWFGDSPGGRQLLLRRGGLLVDLTVGHGVDDENYDPAKAMSTLAGAVLERLPDVGRTATGRPHEMVMTVTGADAETATVLYTDPIAVKAVQETVPLPWTKTFQLPVFGKTGMSIDLSSYVTAIPTLTTRPSVSCRVTVDGVEEASGAPGQTTNCNGSFTEKS